MVSLPKTIDNDLWGTDMTFGFQSAVNIATNAIDCIHTTAASHRRVFIVEVMGHKVGWLTLHAGSGRRSGYHSSPRDSLRYQRGLRRHHQALQGRQAFLHSGGGRGRHFQGGGQHVQEGTEGQEAD